MAYFRELPKVGDQVSTWFAGNDDGLSTVISIKNYDGEYPNVFQYVLRCTADNTQRGYMDLPVTVHNHHEDY